MFCMPAIVGPVAINSVGGGVINFGDSFYISPKSASKTSAGSGALNTGNFVITNNGLSATNTIDPDINDQDIVANK
jgi:spore germination protein PF